MYSKLIVACLLGCLAMGQAHAQDLLVESAADQPAQDVGEAMTVRQMLAIDATLGLHTEQQRFQDRLKAAASRNPQAVDNSPGVIMTPPADGPSPQPAALPPDLLDLTAQSQQEDFKPVKPAVVGVFGLGRHLYADVLLDGSKYRFESGRELPSGVSKDFGWRLKAITPPCVILVSQAQTGENVKTCISSEVFK